MAHRLFIAIRPPEPVRDRLVDAMEGIEGARWVDEENLHLTLRFLGEVERPAANDLAAALARVSAAPFMLSVDGVGHFDKPQCQQVCPVDCIPFNPDVRETQEELLEKYHTITAIKTA